MKRKTEKNEFWTISEAIASHIETNEISSWVQFAKDKKEKDKVLDAMIVERITENIVFKSDFEDEKEYYDEVDRIFKDIKDSHDGYGWYRYDNGEESYAWNVYKHTEMP